MKKLILSICVATAIICFAACGTSQSTAAQLSTPTTNTSTQSDLFKAGEQLGAALKFFSDQKATNGKINYEDPTTYLQMAVIIQNTRIIKANYKDKTQYATLVKGLKAKSDELINEENADAVIDVLMNKIANSESGKKIQNNVTDTKNWIEEHQDTINAMNTLLETLKN